MTPSNPIKIAPAKGKLAILTPGMGAVATTLFAGVEAVKRGIAKPIGSYTQMGQIRLGLLILLASTTSFSVVGIFSQKMLTKRRRLHKFLKKI
jgi:hypothetical protein